MNSQVWRQAFIATTLAFVLLAAAACGGGEATSTPDAATATEMPAESATTEATATTVTAATTDATTSPLAALESPLGAMASPLAIPAIPTVEPETSDTAGALVGRLVVRGPQGEIPVRDTIIGLAEVIRDEQGVMRVSGYDLSTPNRVSTDDAGQFVLSNIPAGTYTIIVDAVVTQIQLENDETGETIIAEIAPNEVTDLGLLSYESLPIPLP